MAISMNWIKDYVDYGDADLKDVANRVTKAGINVEKVESHYIPHLVIGEVVECTPHPDSDHLHVCQVSIGQETLQIVCGASNVRVGIKVIVALPGALLPPDVVIQKSTIRGVESNGMLCALYELGFAEKTKEAYDRGIEEVDASIPVGLDACRALGYDDTLFELDLNPNRSDCNNHIPFSYEVAAVLGKKVTLPSTETHPIKDSVKDSLQVKVETSNCSMYLARMVKDIVIGPSPDFIKHRLEASGMRSINNVVDISNYVMLEYGQPLHFFDADKLGGTILVRMAKDQEEITTLDGKARVLREEDIVITDGEKPVCIAGVMGGANSGIDENTKTIVIESAIFDPYHVRYTSIHHELRSEASLRYEKGLTFEYCQYAMERACHLLEKYASGKVLSDCIVHDKTDKTKKQVSFTLEEINQILGMELTVEDVNRSLDGLGFVYQVEKDVYQVEIPTRRTDVAPNKADLAEEIGRLYGYDHIEATLPTTVSKPGRYIGDVSYRKAVSRRLRSLGLNEVRTYTLISEEEDATFQYARQDAISLLRPMSSDKKVIRQTLLPSLLKVLDYNLARHVKDVCIYEMANVYFNEQEEDTKLAILMHGSLDPVTWQNKNRKVDFYLLKGIIENIFHYLGLQNRYSFTSCEIPDFHPGIAANILLDRQVVGVIGKVHPNLAKDAYVLEISLKKSISSKVKPIKFKEVSKYPSVKKDLAFVTSKEVSSQMIQDEIKKAGGRLLTDIQVFDVYEGEHVGKEEKSIAYSLTFQDATKTLTDEEVMNIFHHIIERVEDRLPAKVRDK